MKNASSLQAELTLTKAVPVLDKYPVLKGWKLLRLGLLSMTLTLLQHADTDRVIISFLDDEKTLCTTQIPYSQLELAIAQLRKVRKDSVLDVVLGPSLDVGFDWEKVLAFSQMPEETFIKLLDSASLTIIQFEKGRVLKDEELGWPLWIKKQIEVQVPAEM